jgi:hypothetical protein
MGGEAAVIRLIEDGIAALLPASLVLAVIVFVVRLVGRLRRHHPIANMRFMARYRAEHPMVRRTIADAPVDLGALPVVRHRTPAGAGPSSAKPTAPAGSSSGGWHAP